MFFYRVLNFLLAPLLIVYIVWKGVQCRQLRFVLQRFGLALGALPQNCLWFHCASVGETSSIVPLIRELYKRKPGLCFLITTNTATGARIAARVSDVPVYHAYLPFDWWLSMARFVSRTRPLGLCIVDTELWPNMLQVCKNNRVPVCIVNARLSPRTTETGTWLKKLHTRSLQRVNKIFTRSDYDRDRFIDLGVAYSNVTTLGNIKFSPPDISSIAPQHLTEREYVVAASTHHDEELMIAQLWHQLHRKELLVIAIRHPERSTEVIKQLKTVTENIAVRSRDDMIDDSTEIYLLDTVGELASWFQHAKVVIMGGSFVPVGGHNILEPAHFGKAVIFGPHVENFAEECQYMLDNNAAILAKSIDELEAELVEILEDESARSQLEQNIKQAARPYRNIVATYADAVQRTFGL